MSYHIILLFGIIGFYIIGSIPFGLLITRIVSKKDIRQEGSGNIGATNAARIGGKWIGIAVFICDGLKGLLAILAGMHFDNLTTLAFGMATFMGHIFSMFLLFKGGKGVSVFVFSLFGLDWRLGTVFAITWAIIFIVTKYVSVASLMATLNAYFATCFMVIIDDPTISISSLLFVTTATSLIILKHLSNLHRLFNGTEYKFNKTTKAI